MPQSPSSTDLFAVFGRIGLVSFGGPAGQIALMHRVLVDERGWMREDEYLSALNFFHLLPGPEAMQLATYAGWRLDGVRGGLIAGLLFVLPGAAVILALSVLYAYAADLAAVEAVFFGVKAAVLAIVLQAVVGMMVLAFNHPYLLGFNIALLTLIGIGKRMAEYIKKNP
jgi:chromate transporter